MDYTLLKNLGHSYDEHLRDNSLDGLIALLKGNPNLIAVPQNMSDIWEGLFFFFWHADKPKYQNETAKKIAGITLLLPVELQLLWFQSALQCIKSRWNRIDHFRHNKFLYFMRAHLHAALEAISRHRENMHRFIEIIYELIQPPEDPLAADIVPLFLIEIYLDELQSTLSQCNLGCQEAIRLIRPIFASLSLCKKKVYRIALTKEVNRIARNDIPFLKAIEKDRLLHMVFRYASGASTDEAARHCLYNAYKAMKGEDVGEENEVTEQKKQEKGSEIIKNKIKQKRKLEKKNAKMAKKLEKQAQFQDAVPEKLYELMKASQGKEAEKKEEEVAEVAEVALEEKAKEKAKKVKFNLQSNTTRLYSESMKVISGDTKVSENVKAELAKKPLKGIMKK